MKHRITFKGKAYDLLTQVCDIRGTVKVKFHGSREYREVPIEDIIKLESIEISPAEKAHLEAVKEC